MTHRDLGLTGNDEGAVSATLALSLFALIAAGAVAFDYARLASMDTELQNAADQAALAAASQLDGKTGACARASAAAVTLIKNRTLMANDSSASTAPAITITSEPSCDATGDIRFWKDKAKTTAATTFEDAKFVEVQTASRTAKYTLTPVVSAFTGTTIYAQAFAGLGNAICRVPPMMICNPNPAVEFDGDAMRGVGIQVTGHGNTRTGSGNPVQAWAPGDFGFLEVGSGQNADLIKALAYQNPLLDCSPDEGGNVSTGNPQGLYDAINTRFDIYDFSSGNGTALGPCMSGSCPAAANVTKDLVKADMTTNGNSCKIHNQGWKLPTNQFSPHDYSAGSGALTVMDGDGVDAMGLPRDNCHYSSFGRACRNYNGTTGSNVTDRVGNGEWARGDYFDKYHPSVRPASPGTITRYDTYLWEITANTIPHPVAGSNGNQYGRAVCSTGSIAAGIDRRVLTVAVVGNCSSLAGASRTVEVDDWVDMFLVEPTIDGRGNGSIADSIYMEVIGTNRSVGTGSISLQTVRKSVPYLIE